MSSRDARYYAEDEIRFLDDLFDRLRLDVLEKYTAIILNDQRSWDPGVDVGRVKEHAEYIRSAARALRSRGTVRFVA